MPKEAGTDSSTDEALMVTANRQRGDTQCAHGRDRGLIVHRAGLGRWGGPCFISESRLLAPSDAVTCFPPAGAMIRLSGQSRTGRQEATLARSPA